MAVHLAIACAVYDGVFFVLSFFPRGVLDEILNLIESVSEVFSSYSYIGRYIASIPQIYTSTTVKNHNR